MIHYVVTAWHRYTIDKYLDWHGRSVSDIVRPIGYDELIQARQLPKAAYVFSDIERLRSPWRELAVDVWQALADAGARLLNHPSRSARRFELLGLLHERGINDFSAYAASGARRPERYPVFVRRANDHSGARSGLIADRQELERRLAALEDQGERREDLLVVELAETADAGGIYRKYSSFVVGQDVIPRHLFFGRDWMLKVPQLLEPQLLAEEREYVTMNPHAEQLRAIFAAAGIQYGRIDYALTRDGRIQVWEINTNPYISSPTDIGGAERAWVGEHFAGRFNAALRELAAMPIGDGPSHVHLQPPREWPGPGWPSRRRPVAWPGKLARRTLRACGLARWEEPVMAALRRVRYRD